MRMSDWSSDVCSSDLSFGAPSERTDAGKEALQPALLTSPREFALAGIGDLGVCHACRCNAVIGGDVGRANQTGNLDIFIAAIKRELLLPAHQHRAIGENLRHQYGDFAGSHIRGDA